MPDQSPSKAWIESALKVTGHFEDSSDPMGAVSGDFDGMGISIGVLQWNIGSNSLQPLIRKIGQAGILKTMPVYGHELWAASTSAVPQGLSIVRNWQVGSRLRPPVMAELKEFTHGPDFVEQQIALLRRLRKSPTRQLRHGLRKIAGRRTKRSFAGFSTYARRTVV